MKGNFILILFVFVFSGSRAQSSLNLNLTEGKEYRQNTEAKMTMSQTFGGQTMNIAATIRGRMVYLVKSVTPTGYDMDIRYEATAMEMQMPQATVKFDSENPVEGDILSQVLASMINKPFQVQFSKTGRVISIKNIDALFEGAFDKFPAVSEAQKDQIKNQLKQSYGEQAFASNIEMMLAIFPDKPVKIGEKWTVQNKLKSSVNANISTTYQYMEEGADFRKIHGDSKITAEENGEYVNSNGMDMKFNMNGTMISDIKVDKKTGWVLEAKITQDIAGDAHVKANEQMPDGMSIPMTIKTEMVNTSN
jgi:hypothetical protein